MDQEQFYTRVIRYNPHPPGARNAMGCAGVSGPTLALLVVKDTEMGFGRMVLFSVYHSLVQGMESGDPPCLLPLLAQAPALLQRGEKAWRAFAANTSQTRGGNR